MRSNLFAERVRYRFKAFLEVPPFKLAWGGSGLVEVDSCLHHCTTVPQPWHGSYRGGSCTTICITHDTPHSGPTHQSGSWGGLGLNQKVSHSSRPSLIGAFQTLAHKLALWLEHVLSASHQLESWLEGCGIHQTVMLRGKGLHANTYSLGRRGGDGRMYNLYCWLIAIGWDEQERERPQILLVKGIRISSIPSHTRRRLFLSTINTLNYMMNFKLIDQQWNFPILLWVTRQTANRCCHSLQLRHSVFCFHGNYVKKKYCYDYEQVNIIIYLLSKIYVISLSFSFVLLVCLVCMSIFFISSRLCGFGKVYGK